MRSCLLRLSIPSELAAPDVEPVPPIGEPVCPVVLEPVGPVPPVVPVLPAGPAAPDGPAVPATPERVSTGALELELEEPSRPVSRSVVVAALPAGPAVPA